MKCSFYISASSNFGQRLRGQNAQSKAHNPPHPPTLLHSHIYIAIRTQNTHKYSESLLDILIGTFQILRDSFRTSRALRTHNLKTTLHALCACTTFIWQTCWQCVRIFDLSKDGHFK